MATLSTRKGVSKTLEIKHVQNVYGQFITTAVKLPFTGHPDKRVTMELTEDVLDDLIMMLNKLNDITTTLI